MARNPNRSRRRRRSDGEERAPEDAPVERAEGESVEPEPEPQSEAEPEVEPAPELEADTEANGVRAADEAEQLPAHAGGGRGGAILFLRNVAQELRRVQWPDRHGVTQATTVVLGFVVIAGAFLGLADAIWKPVIDAIL